MGPNLVQVTLRAGISAGSWQLTRKMIKAEQIRVLPVGNKKS